MKILIITSPDHNTDNITALLSEKGYGAKTVGTIETAADTINQDHYDLLFLPATGSTEHTRDAIGRLRRSSAGYIYITALIGAGQAEDTTTLSAGANCTLESAAIAVESLDKITKNADRLQNLINVIGNNTIDFPSAGGIIARSAFNQLFLSALDRGNRHAELSSVLMISLENYQELYNIGGNYVVDYAIALLSKTLVDIRRQSDIIGQIKNHAFYLLLQMPKSQTEPVEAAQRFAKTLKEHGGLQDAAPTPLGIKVSLVSVPGGDLQFEEFVVPEKE